MKLPTVRIVGAGLIGTSIALKLRELGASVSIADIDPVRQKVAQELIEAQGESAAPELVVIATPPKSAFERLEAEFALYPNATFIDVSSVKTNLQRKVERFPALVERFVSTHPIAGREVAGPHGAQADLFEGRAWIIIETGAAQDRILRVVELIGSLGATVYRMGAKEHDQLFARISHLPQLLSTGLALSLRDLGEDRSLAGSGLRDMVRLAGSDGGLWREILIENKAEIVASLNTFATNLELLRSAVADEAEEEIAKLFQDAKLERDKLSGKHGAKARDYSFVDVVIDDRPGQLAAIFNECGTISVNVEDLALEHSPRQQTGLIRLALSREDAAKLQMHLTDLGWRAHLR